MDDDYQMFKIVIIGSTGTGKTNIATRYIRNQFNQSQKATVGVQFLSKIVQVRNQNIKVTLWDTAGQERYKSLSKVYYKGASGVLIVYDVTEPQSYLDVQSWMRLANENLNLNEVVLMIVGNKIDMQGQRKVPTQKPIKQYKDKFDIDCWQVSAKTGYNVRQIFAQLLERIYQKTIYIKDNGFNDLSQYGSVADQSIIGARKTVAPRQSVHQQVIIEEQKQDQKIKPANVKKTKQPVNQPPPIIPQNKQKGTVLKAGDVNKAKDKKQSKGCC